MYKIMVQHMFQICWLDLSAVECNNEEHIRLHPKKNHWDDMMQYV